MLDNLSESFSALREFNGSAAHEFRTPLAIMQAQIELYEQEEHENVDQETAEMIAMMKEQTSRLSHLVKSLLDMSELQTIPRIDPVELQSLIEEVLADLSSLAEKNGVQLIQKKRDDLIYTGSDILLYRMLFNLTEMRFATIIRADAIYAVGGRERGSQYLHHGGGYRAGNSKGSAGTHLSAVLSCGQIP